MRPNNTGIDWRSGSEEEKEKMREYQRKYREKNLEKVKKSARIYALSRYGLTLDEYQMMFDAQHGECKICLQTQEGELLSVDHCHETGRVRGLLCRQCNRALGLFYDDYDMMFRAAAYLRDHHDL